MTKTNSIIYPDGIRAEALAARNTTFVGTPHYSHLMPNTFTDIGGSVIRYDFYEGAGNQDIVQFARKLLTLLSAQVFTNGILLLAMRL